MAAGIAALKLLQKQDFYSELEEKSAWLASRLQNIAEKAGLSVQINRAGSLMTSFFTPEPVTDFESAMTSNTDLYGRHYRQMLGRGIYLAPSQFEVAFISAAHTIDDLEKMAKMTEWSFKKLLEI